MFPPGEGLPSLLSKTNLPNKVHSIQLPLKAKIARWRRQEIWVNKKRMLHGGEKI